MPSAFNGAPYEYYSGGRLRCGDATRLVLISETAHKLRYFSRRLRRELFERLAFYGQVAGKLLSPDHLHRAELKTTFATRCGFSGLQDTRRRAQRRAFVPSIRHPRQIPHEVLCRTHLRVLYNTIMCLFTS